MKYFGAGLSEKHKELQRIIRKAEETEQAKKLFLELHAKLHRSEVSLTEINEVDKLLDDLKDYEYAIMPTRKDETIAWVLWHIARIEDLTMNILVAGADQVFDETWQKKMNVTITDTGNAMSDEEIMALSQNIDKSELVQYRNTVGKRTRQIVQMLAADDMRRPVGQHDLERIRQAGGVAEAEDSLWLLDFWGKKDIAGLLMMPPTRHVILHLNDCCKWKEAVRTRKRGFLFNGNIDINL